MSKVHREAGHEPRVVGDHDVHSGRVYRLAAEDTRGGSWLRRVLLRHLAVTVAEVRYAASGIARARASATPSLASIVRSA
jgi:hypothetical protein